MFAVRSFRRIRLAALAAAIVIACGAGADGLPGPIPATVTRVIDGDTLEVRARIWLGQEVTVSVRLADVDAPETFRPDCAAERALGEEATAFVEALALSEVALADVEHDKYGGRVVARLILPDGQDLSALLLDQGLAAPITDDPTWCSAPS
jgi:endonuclease YncB( thermonuclease family)